MAVDSIDPTISGSNSRVALISPCEFVFFVTIMITKTSLSYKTPFLLHQW